MGLDGLGPVHANLSIGQLYDAALLRREVQLSADRAIIARTGQHTGRSPNDKYIVRNAFNTGEIAWGPVNQPYEEASFNALRGYIASWLKGRDIFVQDLFAGAEPAYQLPIRVITTTAWHSLFARNMFIRPSAAQQGAAHEAAFTVLHVPEFLANPARDKTRAETFVILNFDARLAIIGGTSYAGEIKKTIFTVMNYLLPAKGVLPMHASANEGAGGDVAIFFGLSGTGKTTLSADSSRTLIGDDEHGWSDNAVFNFEGGCYAKVIRLDPKQEPEIYAASTRYGTVLENVVLDSVTHRVDFDDSSLTENTRSCYPIDFIANASPSGCGGLPKNIIMLTCDAYGVLPPVSKLTAEQAMYHFLSGYTARVAGTEKGVTEPQATFSACFGAPFMPRPPELYAELLGKKIAAQHVNCWLLNTGWSGGGAGVGRRMPIHITRSLLRAVLSGELAAGDFRPDGVFGLMIPASCPGVDANLLHPRDAWHDKAAYDASAQKVVGLFQENFKKFNTKVAAEILKAGIGG
ncbi:MAG: phosphoenolpyruvate carboxykinase (ATP) [Pseudomonadota bacterium]|nr:phosphoenolpyruvate carboxykinase (ATP) [Pseudomonadota bacterium]